MQPDDFAPGTVWLVGAGPGDPELLTMKAMRLIERADIIFYDALVGEGVRALIPPRAERISVGKRSGRHSKDQRTIDALLVAAARSGKRVLRLKGGDPALFARAAEEIAALKEAGFAVRICPGITAASAAAASAGISLSLRGVARDVRFVTAHSKRGAALDIDWASLARSGSTLAFYMGRDAADEIMHGLIRAGMAGDMPVMIACHITAPEERRLTTRLDLLELATRSFAADAPTLILVGEAVGLADVAPAGFENIARADHSGHEQMTVHKGRRQDKLEFEKEGTLATMPGKLRLMRLANQSFAAISLSRSRQAVMPERSSIYTTSSLATLPVAPGAKEQPPNPPIAPSTTLVPACAAARTLTMPVTRVLWKWTRTGNGALAG